MARRHVRRIALVTVLPATVIGLLTVVAISNAAPAPGCGPVDAAIEESDVFAPAGQRLTSPLDPPVTAKGIALPEVVPDDVRIESIDGLPFRWVVLGLSGAVYQYFLDSPIPASMTVSEFLGAGGIQFDRDPAQGTESFAEYMLATLGDRAVRVEVGEHVGAMTWADPDEQGRRPHHLYWTSGGYNYALYGDRSAEEILTLGRELACGSLA
jgi:hypothetical protein